MKHVDISVTSAAYFAAASGILILPLPLLFSAVVAAIFHEFCHCLALFLLRVPIQAIRIGALGAKIHVGIMSPWHELICAASGPAGSLSLMLAARRFPLLALFGFLQGVFNLLPLYPMDGGRILRSFLNLCRSQRDTK